MIRSLTTKDKIDFIDFCSRYKVENSTKLYNNILKRGSKCTIDDVNGDIKGMLVVEKVDKNYILNIYTKDRKIASNLVKQYIWSCKTNLHVQLPINSPFVKVLMRLGFRIYSKRGNPTIDMIREFNKKFYFKKKVNHNG